MDSTVHRREMRKATVRIARCLEREGLAMAIAVQDLDFCWLRVYKGRYRDSITRKGGDRVRRVGLEDYKSSITEY